MKNFVPKPGYKARVIERLEINYFPKGFSAFTC